MVIGWILRRQARSSVLFAFAVVAILARFRGYKNLRSFGKTMCPDKLPMYAMKKSKKRTSSAFTPRIGVYSILVFFR